MSVMRSQLRQRLWDSTKGHCYYCRQPLIPDDQPSQKPLRFEAMRMGADHKNPPSRGGSDAESNLVPACFVCNTQKSDMTAQEYRAFLFSCGVEARFYSDHSPKRDWLLCGRRPLKVTARVHGHTLPGHPHIAPRLNA